LINMYKPPGLSNTQFLLIAKQLHIDKNCILLGDFNIDLSGGDNAEITAHFCALGLGQLINQPTRITQTSSSCIDNVFSSLRGTSGFILEADIADHLVVGILPASKSKVKITPKYYVSPLQDPRSLSYLKDFFYLVWTGHLYLKTTLLTHSLVLKRLSKMQMTYAALLLKKGMCMRPIEPWFSKGLLKSCATKEKLHRKTKKGRILDLEKYKMFRNIYYRRIRAAKLIYYTKAFNKVQGKGKQIWDLAKEVTGISKKQSEGIGEIEGCQTTEEKNLSF
jgi:hypothetical protein